MLGSVFTKRRENASEGFSALTSLHNRSQLHTFVECHNKHEQRRYTLTEKYEKRKNNRLEEQSFAVFGYHLFAFSFSFAKKGIFVLKSGIGSFLI